MIIAAAQTVPARENITFNLQQHYQLIKQASGLGVQLIIFPELSITGYERELAKDQAFTVDDNRLDGLIRYAEQYHMTIVAGAPVRIEEALFIGAFVIFPDRKVSVYTKQFLHDGEEQFFAYSFDHNPAITLEGQTVSLAICADIENAKHPEKAAEHDADLYLASIFYSPKGIGGAHELLGNYAARYDMAVLMSNFGGDSYGMPSGGQSAFWNRAGELIAKLESSGEGLVVVEQANGKWKGKAVGMSVN